MSNCYLNLTISRQLELPTDYMSVPHLCCINTKSGHHMLRGTGIICVYHRHGTVWNKHPATVLINAQLLHHWSITNAVISWSPLSLAASEPLQVQPSVSFAVQPSISVSLTFAASCDLKCWTIAAASTTFHRLASAAAPWAMYAERRAQGLQHKCTFMVPRGATCWSQHLPCAVSESILCTTCWCQHSTNLSCAACTSKAACRKTCMQKMQRQSAVAAGLQWIISKHNRSTQQDGQGDHALAQVGVKGRQA